MYLTWRSAKANDSSLLYELFKANKLAEFGDINVSTFELQPLLDMQYRARNIAYAKAHPHAVDKIILFNDIAVGHHLFTREPNVYRTIDLAVLPEYQNQGIGTWAARQVQQLAALEVVPFQLSVSRSSPAAQLYRRLNFNLLKEDAIFLDLEWRP